MNYGLGQWLSKTCWQWLGTRKNDG